MQLPAVAKLTSCPSIVAVHGLGGDAFGTWTDAKSGICWVRDLLPYMIPGTRVMVFGYNAKRINHGAELDFLDVARQLIAGLSRLRANHQVCRTEPCAFQKPFKSL